MRTREFGIDDFGKNPFFKHSRKEMIEKWTKMTDAEKIAMMNDRINACKNSEQNKHLTVEAMDKRCEEWMKMSASEKQTLIDKRNQMFEEKDNHPMPFR